VCVIYNVEMPITSKKGLFLSFKCSSTRQRRPKKVHVPLTLAGSSSNSKDYNASSDSNPGVLNFAGAQPVLFNVDASSGPTTSTKRQKLEEDWVAIQHELLNVGLSLEVPAQFNCDVCGQHTAEPIRCFDCNANFICCVTCEVQVHQHVLHKPEIWKVWQFILPWYS